MVNSLSSMLTWDFNPRPPRGGRLFPPRDWSRDAEFQSTPPARGATTLKPAIFIASIFQSTPPARGATRESALSPLALRFQSTPPARGATVAVDGGVQVILISIHAPREGGDRASGAHELRLQISIHAPREGGDCAAWGRPAVPRHFNPRPPRGGRLGCTILELLIFGFQSTPPARGATAQ